MVNDDKFIEIKQNWWHIEEIYSPNNARVIRQVMDIFTNESQIPIILTDKFVGLKVTARNSSNREIAFLEYSDSIILNLTDLNSFPSIPNELKDSNILYGYNSRHVRIEIEYISIDPKIGDLENEETFVGARSMKPSGSSWSFSFQRIKVRRKLSLVFIKRS